MTGTPPSQPPGWYHAQGDPPGSQRYWDGSQWVGEPQQAAQPPGQSAQPQPSQPQYTQPQYDQPQYDQPQYGQAPPGQQQYGQEYGQQPFAQPQYAQHHAGAGTGAPAEYGSRVVAFLIDTAYSLAIMVGVVVLGLIGLAIAEGLGLLLFVIGYLGLLGFQIWNIIIRQGQTGQTLGKQRQNISLVADDTRQPIGIGQAVLRWIIPGVVGGLTLGVFSLLDLLWPLWDEEKKRLVDKIIHAGVVNT